MSDFQKQYALWDEFLSVWPASRLATMTLDEYSQAGSKDSFTYWIESGLDKLGSIWGGSSFKFGVFSRKDTEDKKSDAKLSYSDTHGWYSSLGASAEDAFEKVQGFIVQVADWASRGDLDAIDAFQDLGEAYKWKIAFHYQNRQTPVVVDIFKRAPLAVFIGGTASQSMAALQKSALTRRPADVGILEFGRQVWEAWSDKNLAIWKLSHGNPPNFTEAERQQYLDGHWAVMHRDTGKEQGKKFSEAPVGTLFFLCHGNSPQRIGQFTSDAMPCAKGDGWLQRSYRVLKPAQRTDRYTANSKGWSPQGNSTFWQVGANDLPEFENTLLKPFFATDLAELAALAGEPIEATTLGTTTGGISTPVSPSGADHVPLAGCINRIYYGPPGTGKTKTVLDLLKADYTDAPQQIDSPERQRQAIAERMATARWWEAAAAALHDLGGQAKVSDLAEHRFVQAMVAAAGTNRSIKQTLWRTLQTYTVEESATVRLKKRLSPSIFDKGDDSVWHFAGEWQEACADLIEWVDALKKGGSNAAERKRYRFVTFHQSYGYEEFIEGLRPVLATDSEAEADSVAYEMRAGVFKELCREARLSPGQRFALVIDEINRGNISKIFGELITLVEADKRDPLDGTPPPAEVTLAYSGEKFSVPANVDVIGTMNTADRSLALLDTALRRRFDFVALMPDTRAEKVADDPHSAPLAGLMVATEQGEIDVRRMLENINARIEALYDRDHSIGHAYFTHLWRKPDGQERFAALTDTFRNRIVPLLEEYFFEDWQKIRLVLADNQKQDPQAQFIIETEDHGQDLTALFGNDHGLDVYATKRRYALQEDAFFNPQAYIGVYQSPGT
jgi:5-methylcytosine-specific restriction protein B